MTNGKKQGKIALVAAIVALVCGGGGILAGAKWLDTREAEKKKATEEANAQEIANVIQKQKWVQDLYAKLADVEEKLSAGGGASDETLKETVDLLRKQIEEMQRTSAKMVVFEKTTNAHLKSLRVENATLRHEATQSAAVLRHLVGKNVKKLPKSAQPFVLKLPKAADAKIWRPLDVSDLKIRDVRRK